MHNTHPAHPRRQRRRHTRHTHPAASQRRSTSRGGRRRSLAGSSDRSRSPLHPRHSIDRPLRRCRYTTARPPPRTAAARCTARPASPRSTHTRRWRCTSIARLATQRSQHRQHIHTTPRVADTSQAPRAADRCTASRPRWRRQLSRMSCDGCVSPAHTVAVHRHSTVGTSTPTTLTPPTSSTASDTESGCTQRMSQAASRQHRCTPTPPQRHHRPRTQPRGVSRHPVLTRRRHTATSTRHTASLSRTRRPQTTPIAQ